jgi:MYXO-CTERM domain-containing protein
LGAVLTAAPVMFGQAAADQQQSPQTPPAATDQTNNTQPSSSTMPQAGAPAAQVANQNANPGTMPQSDQTAPNTANNSAPSDQDMIYGTGMTVSELKQAGYTDDQISQMRSDSQALTASNSNMASPGTASGNQDQSPSAANGVSQPSDMNSTANQPAKAQNDRTWMWGLLGLLGLLGLAGRRSREVVVQREPMDTAREHDRMRVLAERDARAAREREIAASEFRDQDIMTPAARDREIIREREALRDRDAIEDRNLNESSVQRNLREREMRDEVRAREARDRELRDELQADEARSEEARAEEMREPPRDRKVMDILRDRDRNRRRSA